MRQFEKTPTRLAKWAERLIKRDQYGVVPTRL